jgi:hypothetical protein
LTVRAITNAQISEGDKIEEEILGNEVVAADVLLDVVMRLIS